MSSMPREEILPVDMSLLTGMPHNRWSYEIGLEPPYRRRAAIQSEVESGTLPALDNGWSLVIDRRPDGHTDDYIPAREFATYFAGRQVPMADTDHRLHQHDIGHIKNYQDMFGVRRFADLVQTAAQRAIAEEGDWSCERFTNVVDNFGDALSFLEGLDGEWLYSAENYYSGTIVGARKQLTALIELERDLEATVDPQAEQALFDELWQTLGLARYARLAHRRDEQTLPARERTNSFLMRVALVGETEPPAPRFYIIKPEPEIPLGAELEMTTIDPAAAMASWHQP